MDFGDTPALAAFRAEVRAWLEQATSELPGHEPADMVERLAYFRAWQRRLNAAGYAGLHWPPEYGGRGATVLERAVFIEELDRVGAPDPVGSIGETFAGPTIIDFGTDEQKQRFLPAILAGDDIWCQLFSEPGAGSDLAALQARATQVDGGWRISGQKVWTSRAQVADHGILLARTGGPRHTGITYFLLPMRQDGVTVRPLRQITGDAEFNEVFLEDAFVADGLVLGDVDDGWRIARATLQYERAGIAMGRFNVQRWVDELLELVRAGGHGEDPLVRQRVADIYARALAHRFTSLRSLTRIASGEAPGPESSVGKLFVIPLLKDIADTALALTGLAGQVDDGGEDLRSESRWQRRALFARGMAIAGGTTQIQKNIVAERVLGLPR
jgi:alkylation response protein AidB-like acyl-CoA dehydrogenase